MKVFTSSFYPEIWFILEAQTKISKVKARVILHFLCQKQFSASISKLMLSPTSLLSRDFPGMKILRLYPRTTEWTTRVEDEQCTFIRSPGNSNRHQMWKPQSNGNMEWKEFGSIGKKNSHQYLSFISSLVTRLNTANSLACLPEIIKC